MTVRLSRHAVCLALAAALLGGCGGTQNGALTTLMPQGLLPNRGSAHGKTWMLPEAKGDTLVYVANGDAHTVTIYSYSRHNLVGTINFYSFDLQGECVDRAGDVYVTTDGDGGVFEYAHGGTQPIRILNDPSQSMGCSVDLTTGNVAVANFTTGFFDPGNIVVFTQKVPTIYTTGAVVAFMTCGYDDHGNLLAGGYANSSGKSLAFVMLQKGASELTSVSIPFSKGWSYISAIQWDGKYWTVTVPFFENNVIVYRFSINSGVATEKGQTVLGDDAGYLGQTWITRAMPPERAHVVAALGAAGKVQYWDYPRAKQPFASFSDNGYPFGLTVSRPTTR